MRVPRTSARSVRTAAREMVGRMAAAMAMPNTASGSWIKRLA